MRFALSILTAPSVPRYYSGVQPHSLYSNLPMAHIYKSVRKGKPGENRGRKAMGLLPHLLGYDCQAARKNVFVPWPGILRPFSLFRRPA